MSFSQAPNNRDGMAVDDAQLKKLLEISAQRHAAEELAKQKLLEQENAILAESKRAEEERLKRIAEREAREAAEFERILKESLQAEKDRIARDALARDQVLRAEFDSHNWEVERQQALEREAARQKELAEQEALEIANACKKERNTLFEQGIVLLRQLAPLENSKSKSTERLNAFDALYADKTSDPAVVNDKMRAMIIELSQLVVQQEKIAAEKQKAEKLAAEKAKAEAALKLAQEEAARKEKARIEAERLATAKERAQLAAAARQEAESSFDANLNEPDNTPTLVAPEKEENNVFFLAKRIANRNLMFTPSSDEALRLSILGPELYKKYIKELRATDTDSVQPQSNTPTNHR